jgi:hypothetical protein
MCSVGMIRVMSSETEDGVWLKMFRRELNFEYIGIFGFLITALVYLKVYKVNGLKITLSKPIEIKEDGLCLRDIE